VELEPTMEAQPASKQCTRNTPPQCSQKVVVNSSCSHPDRMVTCCVAGPSWPQIHRATLSKIVSVPGRGGWPCISSVRVWVRSSATPGFCAIARWLWSGGEDGG